MPQGNPCPALAVRVHREVPDPNDRAAHPGAEVAVDHPDPHGAGVPAGRRQLRDGLAIEERAACEQPGQGERPEQCEAGEDDPASHVEGG